jgi:hypothetical protein
MYHIRSSSVQQCPFMYKDGAKNIHSMFRNISGFINSKSVLKNITLGIRKNKSKARLSLVLYKLIDVQLDSYFSMDFPFEYNSDQPHGA